MDKGDCSESQQPPPPLPLLLLDTDVDRPGIYVDHVEGSAEEGEEPDSAWTDWSPCGCVAPFCKRQRVGYLLVVLLVGEEEGGGGGGGRLFAREMIVCKEDGCLQGGWLFAEREKVRR